MRLGWRNPLSTGSSRTWKEAAVRSIPRCAGAETTHDVALGPTRTITGRITAPPGVCVQCALIIARDATTGDHAAVRAIIAADGTLTMRGLNTQDVWLYYSGNEELIKYPTLIHTTAGGTVSGIELMRPPR